MTASGPEFPGSAGITHSTRREDPNPSIPAIKKEDLFLGLPLPFSISSFASPTRLFS
jgi:hypothetical protein